MIVGLFVRHYKIYDNLNFISFVKDGPYNLNIFIGPNGAGKSSILEALDCAFNFREWNVTVGQKKQEANICPVFLIPKDSVEKINGFDLISNFFWDTDFNAFSQSETTRKFQSFRDDLKNKVKVEDYYLIAVGINYKRDVLYTSTFHGKMFNTIKNKKVSREDLIAVKNKIYSRYSYIYIPSEANLSEVLSVETREFQALIDKNVIDEIISQLDEKNIQSDDGKSVSIITIINKRLDAYIEDINKRVSAGYSFSVKGARKKTIKARDVVDTILEEYFNIRPLIKDGKQVKELSSGEQRLALMDVIASLLQTHKQKDKEVILAIDEPENSLHPGVCFSQFKRLFQLTTEFGRQVFITTHWYGLLLTPVNGVLHYVNKQMDGKDGSPDIKAFNLKNLHESRRAFPESIEMRSFTDLVSSMCSILMHTNQNWLLCEGSEDAKYLEAYLKNKVSNLYVLPINGCGNAIKLFKYLRVPFEDDTDNELIKGRVMFLVDTDAAQPMPDLSFSTKMTSGKLDIKRLSLWKNQKLNKYEVKLLPVGKGPVHNTVIEDVLNSEVFLVALNKLFTKPECHELHEFKNLFELSLKCDYVALTGGLISLKTKKPRDYEMKERLASILYDEKYKHLLATEYVSSLNKMIVGDPKFGNLEWTNSIVRFFND
ncbi:ATP-binding protein [Aeromonas sp. DNRA1]|uniref:ATP-dependent nuclease n=1 Tax=Aeromonas sp. DNRA1 TaxID=2729335 RepID=UPI001459B7E1|nr:ATP-binding protein [Aeromonas sp. DNRA1]NME02445.1 AAA family ATPase [Aeromonas sp. DNRA1]